MVETFREGKKFYYPNLRAVAFPKIVAGVFPFSKIIHFYLSVDLRKQTFDVTLR